MIYRYTCRMATTAERFARFLQYHPDVYAQFCQVARDLCGRGVQHFGAKSIVDVMRYQAVMADEKQPECDNDYIGWMARRLASEDARFVGFFEIRKMRNA
jgi:hypothetical protein